MTITRRGLADEIDLIDEQIASLQIDKSEKYKAYRQQLEKADRTKPEIAAEIVACKAAIRRRQAVAKDQNAVEAKEELVDTIFIEISKPEQTGTRNALTRVSRETPAVARSRRSKTRLSESMADTAEQAHELADIGLISHEAAAETARIADLVATKLGDGPVPRPPSPDYDIGEIPEAYRRVPA